ncbi:hypothetical protein AMTRI_Chr07g29260 [Amborella trichopoda]
MIELIHHAINSGVTFLNTSDAYGPFPNKILLGKRAELASKFGISFADGKMEICGTLHICGRHVK